MLSLDPKSKQLLEQDTHNPDASKAIFTKSVGPSSSTNPRVPPAARSTLKDTIAAQRNAARKLPERPSSAMSSFTPVRQAPQSASRLASKPSVPAQQRAPSGAPSHGSARSAVSTASSASGGQGSLMSAPMRRPKRPDVPRPFTADPYAGRNAIREESPPDSPVLSPKALTKPPVPAKTTSHVKSKSTTSVLASGSAASSRAGSPKVSPIKKPQLAAHARVNPAAPAPTRSNHGILSPTSHEDNFTMIAPGSKTLHSRPFPPVRTRSNEHDRPGTGHSSQLGAIEEDNFTMVMPERTRFDSRPDTFLPQTPKPDSVRNTNVAESKDDAVMVYEDPAIEDVPIIKTEDDIPLALEELPLSEQNTANIQPPTQPQSQSNSSSSSPNQDRPQDQNRLQQRSASPTKRLLPTSPTKISHASHPSLSDSPMPDRAETLKTRRLLASGTERVRAQTLDAHGFRRLQDLIKNNTRNPDLQFASLLIAIVGYLKSSSAEEANSKEKALKGQALNCLRAVVSLYSQRDEQVKQALPDILVGIAEAAAWTTGSSTIELEKTGNEVVSRVATLDNALLVESCINTVADFVGQSGSLSPDAKTPQTPEQRKSSLQAQKSKSTSTALALSILSRLTALYTRFTSSEQRPDVYETIRTRLATFAVRCLSHTDPDVRRKGVDFAVELYGLFPSETEPVTSQEETDASGKSSGKEAFWRLLRPAGEPSCNLLTYYLARRGRVGTVA